MSYIKRALEKFQESEEHEAAFQEWCLGQPTLESVHPAMNYITTLETEFGDLGDAEYKIFGEVEFCEESASFSVEVSRIEVLGAGTTFSVHTSALTKKAKQHIETKAEEQLLLEAREERGL